MNNQLISEILAKVEFMHTGEGNPDRYFIHSSDDSKNPITVLINKETRCVDYIFVGSKEFFYPFNRHVRAYVYWDIRGCCKGKSFIAPTPGKINRHCFMNSAIRSFLRTLESEYN